MHTLLLLGTGVRMGGGKGQIDQYVTPVKAGRIIIELAGRLEHEEVTFYVTLQSTCTRISADRFRLISIILSSGKSSNTNCENYCPPPPPYVSLKKLLTN